jgi:hypothetical protein
LAGDLRCALFFRGALFFRAAVLRGEDFFVGMLFLPFGFLP